MSGTKKQRPGRRTADTAKVMSPIPAESCGEEQDILIIEAFYGGSHGHLADVLRGALKHRAQVYTLTDKKWHWRARTSALYFSQMVPKAHHFRYLFASAVLNLAELVALRPDLGQLKKILFFHENQLVYPAQDEKERDFQYGYNQILSALVADVNLFNSQFNLDSFLSSIKPFLSRIPSGRPPRSVAGEIRAKCRVLYFPLVLPLYRVPEATEFSDEDLQRPLHIVWPHRWEHDKNPDFFVTVLEELHAEDIPFRVSVIGQTYSQVPDSLSHLAFSLHRNLLHYGFLPSKDDYQETLKRADVAVSTADHEFFGVAMLEAAYFGCFPLVPNRLVYPELYEEEHLYDGNSPSNLTDILRTFCLDPSLIRTRRQHLDVSRFSWVNLRSDYMVLFDA
ncbi:hypothetical protein RvY_10451 [Ramazzottius varieornatus]|uniref:tRNA-queuosine alpha-mannosyltransferase n=1 Tax=Ramazzottius varieornatus TaxID=947166 RepID=A0A1D1VI54_RAMVA|nr:hypothetical protein RvY_10451 [Ramazzottius varieornatus]